MSKTRQLTAVRAIAAMAVGLYLAAALCPSLGAAQPTRTGIVLDGTFGDWQTVFSNPLNTVLDGDGSTVPCAESIDRDCIVPSASADIQRFAVTWDETNLYIYVERLNTSNNDRFFVYVDVGHDGLFGPNDWILEHEFKASQGEISPTKRRYVPLGPLGDRTEDPLGFGDGYSLPGDAGNPVTDPPDPGICASCASPDGLAFEFAWPWASLGITADQAIIYHVASGRSVSADAEDNLGGPGDLRGSTLFRDLALDAARITSAGPGQTLHLPHAVTNTGNGPDTARLRVTSSLGMEVCLFDDPDGDGQPDTLIACDRQGNGSWEDSGDFVDPLFDTDGDLAPDTGALAAGTSFPLVLRIQPENKHNRGIEQLRFTAVSTAEPGVAPSLCDKVSIGYVTVVPKREIRSVAGATFYMGHHVANHLPSQDSFNLNWESSEGWSYRLWSDPNEDGFPFDGVELFDTDGDTAPNVNIPAGATFPISVEGAVPDGTSVATEEVFTLEARSSGNVRGKVEDEVLVSRRVELRPDHTLSNGQAKPGSANYPTFFRHFLTWNGSLPAQFELTGLSSQGYQVDFFTDPNGDGNPADGRLLPSPAQTPLIPGFGGTWVFLVRVSIPDGASPGTVDSTQIWASHWLNPLVFDRATDETLVTQIQVFSDANLTRSVSHSPVCAPVHARATGLTPSVEETYRIVWDDPTGQRVRTHPFTSDALGEGTDSISFGPEAALGPWTVAVQEYDGASWNDLDRVVVEVENEGVMDALFTQSQTYSIAETALTATAVFRNNGATDLGPLDIEFRVLSPDESLYLKSNGEFRSFSGNETTWSLGNLRLAPGETVTETFSIVGFEWPTTGTYFLDGLWRNVCGDAVAVTRRTLVVTDDRDGDGLSDDVEATAGLDWTDRDTDDDGLLDGIEGLADSDGDTVPDALSCDSDGDGLADSVESGLVEGMLDPDSDPNAGCFRADGDGGATTTDPVLADSDGGGLTDGQEDLDLDGVVDVGEKDPTASWDDPCDRTTPPEVRDLKLRRDGADLVLTWSSLSNVDPCITYRIWTAVTFHPEPEDLVEVASGLGTTTAALPIPEGLHAYYIQARGPFSGDGPIGGPLP